MRPIVDPLLCCRMPTKSAIVVREGADVEPTSRRYGVRGKEASNVTETGPMDYLALRPSAGIVTVMVKPPPSVKAQMSPDECVQFALTSRRRTARLRR